jgi:hypothetical protein
MANDPTAAVAALDEAIALHEAEDYSGSRAKVEEARDHVTDVPALVGFIDAHLDGFPDPIFGQTRSGSFPWSHGNSSPEAGNYPGAGPVDKAHSLRELRGRVALQLEDPPVFGIEGS